MCHGPGETRFGGRRDAVQLQSVEAGGGFAALVREGGTSTLTEIQRQREEWARQAVRDFATGRSEQALSAYEQRGLLHRRRLPEHAELALVEQWKSSAENPAGNIILTGTNAEISRLNAHAQAERISTGIVYGEPVFLGEEKLHVNDPVLFTRSNQALGVFNGELGTIFSRDRSLLQVQMENGRSVPVDTSEYRHLRLGYALTTHKAQAMTTEQSFILTGPMQNREQTYVQASRAWGDTRFFVGTEDLQRTADRMAHCQPKELASDLVVTGLALELGLLP